MTLARISTIGTVIGMARPALHDDVSLQRLAALYAGGLTIRAVAATLGWSYGLTYSRLHRARIAGLVEMRAPGHRTSTDTR